MCFWGVRAVVETCEWRDETAPTWRLEPDASWSNSSIVLLSDIERLKISLAQHITDLHGKRRSIITC